LLLHEDKQLRQDLGQGYLGKVLALHHRGGTNFGGLSKAKHPR
jgi:hypothetical protein